MIEITFLTLFLGLGSGQKPVELAVQGPVEQIAGLELLLDGAPAGRLAGPPWRSQIDFGPGLLPHELVARAVDTEGRELARVRQWLNLPHSPAELEIALEAGPDGRPAAALLAWQSLIPGLPRVLMTLDGRPLPAGTGAAPTGEARRLRVPLPVVELATAHVLSVELRFSRTVSAHRDLVFGGGGGQVSTELTAVPVKPRQGELPPLAALQGQLLAGGRALRVVAVEDEPAQLVVVRGAGGRPRLGRDVPRYDLALERDARVRLLSPSPRQAGEAGVGYELFDSSGDYTARDGGLPWLLSRLSNPRPRGAWNAGQRPTDAVAVAALQVLAGNGPRAVLLVLGPKEVDRSRYTPQQVRGYLAAVRVPLFVWSLGPPTPDVVAAWGRVTTITSTAGLRAAVTDLKGELAAQRVLWVDGLHLPQSITAAPGGGLELAGMEPADEPAR